MKSNPLIGPVTIPRRAHSGMAVLPWAQDVNRAIQQLRDRKAIAGGGGAPPSTVHPWQIVVTPISSSAPNQRIQVFSGVVSRATWSNYAGSGHPVCTVDETNANYVSGFALPTKTTDFDSKNANAITVAAGTHNVMLAVEILTGTRPTNAATATIGSLVFQVLEPKPVVYVSTDTASVTFAHYASFKIGTVAVTAGGVVTLTQFRRSDIHLDAPHFYQPLMVSTDDNDIVLGTDNGLKVPPA